MENITFHTAAIRWFVTPTSTDVINGTYNITVRRENSTASSNTPGVRSFSLPITANAPATGLMSRNFRVLLSGLEQDTAYAYTISIVSDHKTIPSAHQGSFRTARYCKWMFISA